MPVNKLDYFFFRFSLDWEKVIVVTVLVIHSLIMLRKPAMMNDTVGSSARKCHFQELQPTALCELSSRKMHLSDARVCKCLHHSCCNRQQFPVIT